MDHSLNFRLDEASESHDLSGESTEVPAKTFKMGPFSRDEDIMIGGRVMQWGDKGPGLWEALEEEMGREKSSLKARFHYLAVRKFALDWNQELVSTLSAQQHHSTPIMAHSIILLLQDDKLTEVVSRLPQPTKWADVGKEMGLKTKEVRSRWLTHHLALQLGRNVGPWSDEEVTRGASCVSLRSSLSATLVSNLTTYSPDCSNFADRQTGRGGGQSPDRQAHPLAGRRGKSGACPSGLRATVARSTPQAPALL